MISLPTQRAILDPSQIYLLQLADQNLELEQQLDIYPQSLYIQTLKDWGKSSYQSAKDLYNYGKKGTLNAIGESVDFVNTITTSSEDKDKHFCQIVREEGCVCDSYDVQTNDGYILQMFRIRTQNVAQMDKGQTPAILLQHGLFSSADTWINHYPEFAPAFVFARAGYDVWLGNNRGNKYSRRHININPDKDFKKFFDFSFQDLGEYDLPAQVQKVIDESGRSKISYIGHSQGTSQMFYGLAKHEKDIYQHKINLFVALAPVTKLKGMNDKSLDLLSKSHETIDKFADQAGLYEIFGPTWAKYENTFCKLTGSFCTMFSNLASMTSSQYNDEDRVSWSEQRKRAGASRKQIMHFAQLIQSDEFRAYDYGSMKNLLKYNSIYTPIFDLSKINTVPIALISGAQDTLATPENAQWAKSKIKSVLYSKVLPNCDHSSFLVGKDMSFLHNILQILSLHNSHYTIQSLFQTNSNQLQSDAFGQFSGLY